MDVTDGLAASVAALPAAEQPVLNEAIDRIDAEAKAFVDYFLAGFGGAVAGALHEAGDVATPAVAALNGATAAGKDFTASINRFATIAERLIDALSKTTS